MRLQRFDVLHGRTGALLGYVYANDIDHAWTQAAGRWRCSIAVLGAGGFTDDTHEITAAEIAV